MPMGTLTKTRQLETKGRICCNDFEYFASIQINVSLSAQCLTAGSTKRNISIMCLFIEAKEKKNKYKVQQIREASWTQLLSQWSTCSHIYLGILHHSLYGQHFKKADLSKVT